MGLFLEQFPSTNKSDGAAVSGAPTQNSITLDDDFEWDYDPAAYGSNPATWPFVVCNVLPISGRPQGVTQ